MNHRTEEWLPDLIRDAFIDSYNPPRIGSTESNPFVRVTIFVPLSQWEDAQIAAGVKACRTGTPRADADPPGWA